MYKENWFLIDTGKVIFVPHGTKTIYSPCLASKAFAVLFLSLGKKTHSKIKRNKDPIISQNVEFKIPDSADN